MTTTIYECPDCGDIKMVDHKAIANPTLWCNCEGDDIIKMERKTWD